MKTGVDEDWDPERIGAGGGNRIAKSRRTIQPRIILCDFTYVNNNVKCCQWLKPRPHKSNKWTISVRRPHWFHAISLGESWTDDHITISTVNEPYLL